jgi:HEAT repeat protein
MAMLEHEDDPDLTVAALHSLGLLEDPAAVQAIERHAVGSFLRRPPQDVRIAAYRALRHIGTPRARRLLNQAVDDRDPSVKAEVRRLLGM